MGHGPRSKHNISQCSIAPDYGYKKWSTNREALNAYTQPEGIGYLVRAIFYEWSNLQTFEPKSDHASNQLFKNEEQYSRSTVSKYSRARWSVASVKLQQPTIFKNGSVSQALHCPSYSILVTRSLRNHILNAIFGSRKRYSTALIVSVQSPWRVVCTHVQLNVMHKLSPVTLIHFPLIHNVC